MTMPGQSIFSGRLTSMPPVQLAAWLAHVRRASQLRRESRLPLAAMAMILTPPGLRNIPCRNFPFGTLVALAVCAPWWGQLSPHLPLQTPAKKGSFHTAFPRVHWKPSCGKLLTREEENTYIHTMYIPVTFLKKAQRLYKPDMTPFNTGKLKTTWLTGIFEYLGCSLYYQQGIMWAQRLFKDVCVHTHTHICTNIHIYVDIHIWYAFCIIYK